MAQRLMLFLITFLSSGELFASDAAGGDGLQAMMNQVFGAIVGLIAPFLFFPILGMPFILWIMAGGGVFFTFKYGFVNIRLFRHALDVVAGKYDDPNDTGQISHFQALTSALSATVGLGNIAGVAVAIQVGGPGAVFWLWVVGLFGMSMKFSSCTFAQLYREVDSEGRVLGGPMVYLKKGIADLGLPKIGAIMGSLYAVLIIIASFGGGNLFQGNQTFELLSREFPAIADYGWAVGVTLAFFAGVVLIGGITRIADVTSKLVPAMCVFYFVSCIAIIISNIGEVPNMLYQIVKQAFSPDAIYTGGALGVLIQGVKRASFSNEAGIGSAAIAHAAAKTKEPVREGVVAMIGPFIDTHLVCTMTSLAILVTGAHLDPEVAGKGALITAKAFASLGDWMPTLLTIATVVFAYSTVISWSYYGEQATVHLFGRKAIPLYRVVYVFIVILGPILSLGNVIDFADLALLSAAFPNIIGMIILSPKVKVLLDDYIARYKSGEMRPYK